MSDWVKLLLVKNLTEQIGSGQRPILSLCWRTTGFLVYKIPRARAPWCCQLGRSLLLLLKFTFLCLVASCCCYSCNSQILKVGWWLERREDLTASWKTRKELATTLSWPCMLNFHERGAWVVGLSAKSSNWVPHISKAFGFSNSCIFLNSAKASFVRVLSALASKSATITPHGTCLYNLRSNELMKTLHEVSDPSSPSNS